LSLVLPKYIIEKYFKQLNFLVLLSLGLYPNSIIDKRTNNNSHDNQNIQNHTKIITFQHRTFADIYIINYIFGPIAYVYRDIFKNNIIIKSYIEKFGGIAVSSSSKTGKTKELLAYFENPNNIRKLAIAPEDITDIRTRVLANNKLGSFRSGAFVPKVPIQPVCIKFYDTNVIWKNYKTRTLVSIEGIVKTESNINAESIHMWILRRLFSHLVYFDIYLLEECKYESICNENCTDDIDGINSIVKYKETVRQKMLNTVMQF
jgi:1-acyl-sn-glycerol-3-phosphate acyltransferase